MTDNLRWLIALTAVSVAGYTVIAWLVRTLRTNPNGRPDDPEQRAEHDRATRRRVAISVGGLLVFWSAAQLPPFGPWSMPSGLGSAAEPQVLLACLVYLAIVIASSRGLIGMPIYRHLQARANELRQLADSRCFRSDRARLVRGIDRAEQSGARRLAGFIVQVPLPDVLAANRTLNAIEKQMLSDLTGKDLRLAASQIAALMPANDDGTKAAEAIARAASDVEHTAGPTDSLEGALRNTCATALIVLHRQHDVPQEREVNHIRVSIWLTMVGLAAAYALSVTWSGHEQLLIAGALGGLLGSLSALITNRDISLGMVVLSPVAGALNALGGSIVIGFLAQENIQVLGAAFRDVWSQGGTDSVTALAAAVLLGFSGGLFSRIAVAGTAPLLGGETKTESPPTAALVPAKVDEPRDLGRQSDVAAAAAPSSNGHQPPKPPETEVREPVPAPAPGPND